MCKGMKGLRFADSLNPDDDDAADGIRSAASAYCSY